MINKPFVKYKLIVCGIVAVYLFCALLRVAYSLLLKSVIDAGTSGSFGAFPMIIAASALYLVAYPVSEYLSKSIPAEFTKRCIRDTKNTVIDKITSMDVNTFTANNSAMYISIINNDLKVLETDYYKTILDVILAAITLPVATVTLFILSPTLAVCMLVLLIPAVFIPQLFGKKLEERQRSYNEALDRYNAYIKDIFNGFETIVSFGIAAKVRQTHSEASENVEERQRLLKNAKAKSIAFSSIVFYGGFLASYLVAGALVVVGKITVGTLLGAVQIANSIVNPIDTLIEAHTTLAAAKAVVTRINGLIEAEDEQSVPQLDVLKSVLPIECRNLSFSYGEKLALSGICCKLEQGKKYAIVGGSGSGKSTFLKLLMKYYDDYTGSICMGEQELRQVDRSSLCVQYAVVHQNVVMFNDTVRNNICMFKDYPDAEVMNAVKSAGLAAYVSAMPQGLDTVVEDSGHNLSGGEKQRISIARALLRRVPLLLMDEATASLDPTTAQAVEGEILRQMEITIVSITHRLTDKLLPDYDCIMVMQDGCLVEQGSFAELMGKGGFFCGMYNAAAVHEGAKPAVM